MAMAAVVRHDESYKNNQSQHTENDLQSERGFSDRPGGNRCRP
jgi:hypothetical protein